MVIICFSVSTSLSSLYLKSLHASFLPLLYFQILCLSLSSLIPPYLSLISLSLSLCSLIPPHLSLISLSLSLSVLLFLYICLSPLIIFPLLFHHLFCRHGLLPDKDEAQVITGQVAEEDSDLELD